MGSRSTMLMLQVEFRNKRAGEVYLLGVQLRPGEVPLDVAWGRALRTACRLKAWRPVDVHPVIVAGGDQPMAQWRAVVAAVLSANNAVRWPRG